MNASAAVDRASYLPELLLRRPPDAPRHWRMDGTMVFIDISGFTSLSEQLARRGREGAEALVSTLTRIFTGLMSASDDGGDVVKFAGDAMLIMYDGPDHCAHACHAAAMAQRVLSVVGGVRLAGARARLRMSVGVHTGLFHFLLTGQDSLNLVIAGPDLDTVLTLQDRADAGQILISSEVAASLPASTLGTRTDGARFVRRAPMLESVGRDSRVGAGRRDDLDRFLPPAFREHPDLLLADSDHRRTAMGFAQVSGLTALLTEGPLEVVDRLTDVVEAACRETGVTLLDIDIGKDGFRYFLAAGAPRMLEDPEGRLLRTLVRIVAAETPLSVRAGATSGRVFAGPVGTTSRRTFSVMGDPTNLAARLTARAPAGRVLAATSAVQRSTTTFDVETQPAVSVKGKAEPIAVSIVGEVLGQRARPMAHRFVGRHEELAVTERAADNARRGRRSVVQIVGEPGLGKTRLAGEAARASGLPLVEVRADPYGAQVPFNTLNRLVRAVLGMSASDPPEVGAERIRATLREHAPDTLVWLPLLGPVIGVEIPTTPTVAALDDRFRAARFHDTLLVLFRALLREPVVILLDDAQWADQTSSDAIAAVLARATDQPWMVLITRRASGDGLTTAGVAGVTELPLSPLGPDLAGELVHAATESTHRPHQLHAIVNRAEGNPQFLIELATAEDTELPDSIEGLVSIRVDSLDAPERDLLRQAAVLGTRVSARLFGETTGNDGLLEAARSPGLASFLDVDDGPSTGSSPSSGSVVFRREVYREVAYQQLTFQRRRDVHRRAALALTSDPSLGSGAQLPLLSLHWSACGAWAEAFTSSKNAASVAIQQYANDEAVTFLRRAVDAGRKARRPARELRMLHRQLGDLLKISGQHVSAVQALRAAGRGVSDPEELSQVVDRLARVHQEAGHFGAADRAAGRLTLIAGNAEPERAGELVVTADLLRAGNRFWRGNASACRRVARRAASRAQTLHEGETRTVLLAQAYALHDTAAIELEGRAGDYGELPLRMFREIGDTYREGRFATNVAVGEYYEGRWDRAVGLYRQSRAIAQQIGDVFSSAVADMNIGELLSLQGCSLEAVQLLTDSRLQLRSFTVPQATAHAACYLGQAFAQSGDVESAAHCFEESNVLFGSVGVERGFSIDELGTRRAQLSSQRGKYLEALDEASQIIDRKSPAAALHRSRGLRVRAAALHALGEIAAARDALTQSLAVAQELPLGYEAALALLVRASWSGSRGERLVDQDAAVDILTALGVRLEPSQLSRLDPSTILSTSPPSGSGVTEPRSG